MCAVTTTISHTFLFACFAVPQTTGGLGDGEEVVGGVYFNFSKAFDTVS